MRSSIPVFALAAIAGAQQTPHGKWEATYSRTPIRASGYSETVQLIFTMPDGTTKVNNTCSGSGPAGYPVNVTSSCSYKYMSYVMRDDGLEIKQRYWDNKNGLSDAKGFQQLKYKIHPDGSCTGKGTVMANATVPVNILCSLDILNRYTCNF